MISFSSFRHENTDSLFPHEIPVSKDYKVYVKGQEISVYKGIKTSKSFIANQ